MGVGVNTHYRSGQHRGDEDERREVPRTPRHQLMGRYVHSATATAGTTEPQTG